jgi:prepilin-type processing-associated H-X9-DG protein
MNDILMGVGGSSASGPCNPQANTGVTAGTDSTVALASIPTPAGLYMVADSGRPNGLDGWWIDNTIAPNWPLLENSSAPAGGNQGQCKFGTGWPCVTAFQAALTNSAIYRHQGGSNIAFADGHAKWHIGSQIWSGDGWEDANNRAWDSPDGAYLTHDDGTGY